jgi:DNA-binding transcriptional regulator YiaG
MWAMTERKAQYHPSWDGAAVRALREHLAVTQDGLAAELGVRQQTVSEWETGQYRPRGASARLLTMVAERAGFEYEAGSNPDKMDGRQQPLGGRLEGEGNGTIEP